MTVHRNSRWRRGKVGRSLDVNENVEINFGLYETTREPPARSRRYRVTAGDTFESIAAREYDDGNKWYILAIVNPHVFFPLDLEPGEEILIPPRTYAELL
jgi:hypothetical protein